MHQDDILEYLAKQRMLGNNNYFTVRDLPNHVNENNKTHKKIRKLFWAGYLEIVHEYPTKFRIKDKYVKVFANRR